MPEVRDCPVCGNPTTLHPSEVEGFTACSPACFARARRRFPDLRDLNPLQRRCLLYLEREKTSLRAFALRAGVHPSGLRWWFKRPGSATSRETVTRLAAVLGLSEEEALKEAGGQTAHDVHLRVGQAQAEGAFATNRLKGYTPAVVRKRAAAQTGLKRSPETVEKLRSAQRAPELVTAARERMRVWHMSPRGQVLTRLSHLVAREPAPSEEQLREWEVRVGQDVGLPAEAVEAICKPTYRRLKLVEARSGGPRLMENRHRILEEYMAERGKGPYEPKPRGFWDEAALRLKDRDPDDVTDGPTLRRWYPRHLLVCGRTYFAPRGASSN